MCRKIDESKAQEGIGLWQKGNEPTAMKIAVMAALCACGAIWWAKVRNGRRWVEVERVA